MPLLSVPPGPFSLPPACTSRVELNLGRNQLTELPRELTQLASLVRLDLSSNRLRKLPPGFGRLQMLQQLQLNGNELGTVRQLLPPSPSSYY